MPTYKIRYVSSFGTQRVEGSLWETLTSALVQHIDLLPPQEKVVGIGHSMGGILSLYAYYQVPHRFEKIILMDAPIFRPAKRFCLEFLQFLRLKHLLIPTARKARRRQDYWSSRREAAEYLALRPFFHSWEASCFADYVEHALIARGNGVNLRIPREIEYQIFLSLPTRRLRKDKIRVPSYYIYADSHQSLSDSDIQACQKLFPEITFLPFPGGHMFPMENPEKLAELLKKILEKPNDDYGF
ncbi:MAG: alpha/beta hydrolase [Cytophagales bacterium]|nr:alpha/beta hydrolase [Cytophagales bacterium]